MAFLWTEVEKSPQGVQAAFFNEYLEREQIQSFSDIRRGDHIIFKTSIGDYYHHCLCIGHDAKGNPTVMHYWGTAWGAVSGMSRTSGKNFGVKVQQMQLPNREALANAEDFKKKDAQRIVWPNDMRRFSVDEVIERAREYCKGEPFYDFAKNNCEHFVMWCMCGIRTSLQVKDIHLVLRETLRTVKESLLHTVKSQSPKLAIEAIVNAVDDAGVAVGKAVANGARALSKLSVGLTVGLGALVETLVCGYEIRQTYKQWNDGVLIKSREEFMQKVTEIVCTGVGRFGCGAFGAVIGQIVIPVPILGALIGCLVGAGCGHILGTFLGKYAGRAVCWLAKTFQNLFG